MDSRRSKLCRYISDEATPFLYDIEGHIAIYVKNVDFIGGMSFRQVVKSLPPLIIGHMIHHHENWIDAGALIAEHLTKKFVARALNWIDDVDRNLVEPEYHFDTRIMGFSSHPSSLNEKRETLHGTTIAEWDEYPYRVSYEFHYNVSSTARRSYRWLGYQNNAQYKLRDEKFRKYIQAIVDVQSSQVFNWMYDIDKAMRALRFLVE